MEIKPKQRFNFNSIKPSNDFDNIQLDTVPFCLFMNDVVDEINTTEGKIEFYKIMCKTSIKNANKWVNKFCNKKSGRRSTAEAFLISNLGIMSNLFLNILNGVEEIYKKAEQ